jgi:hypothetical protein
MITNYTMAKNKQNFFFFGIALLELYQGTALVGAMPTRAVLPSEGDSSTAGREVQPKYKSRKQRLQTKSKRSKP